MFDNADDRLDVVRQLHRICDRPKVAIQDVVSLVANEGLAVNLPKCVEFFDKTIAQESGREIAEEQVFWTEIFQPFLLAGLLLYLAYLLVPERPSQGRLATLELPS